MTGLTEVNLGKRVVTGIGRMMLLMIMIYMAGCGDADHSYLYHNENVEGPVKEITERTYGAYKDSLQWKADGFYSQKEFVFDREGRLTEKRIFGADTMLIERFKYKYSDSRRTVERRFDRRGELTHIKKYSYPWFGGQVEAKASSPSESLLWKVSYTFDERGREVKKEIFGPEGRLNYVVTYRYNPENLLIQKEGEDKMTYRFISFDDHGNWLQRLNTKDQVSTTITRRKIQYYE